MPQQRPSVRTIPGKGFGLVELMIALFLSITVMSVIIQVFLSSKQNYILQENLGRLQENGRFAIDALINDIRQAGYLGEIQEYWDITETTASGQQVDTLSGECFTGLYSWATPMIVSGGLTPPHIAGANNTNRDTSDNNDFAGCISDDDYQTDTDIVSVHYVGPEAVSDSNLVQNQLYLRSNLDDGRVFKCNNTGSCIPADAPDTTGTKKTTANYPIYSAAYFVRPWQNNVGDLVPTLVRAVVSTDNCISLSPCVTTEPIVEGVASMQVRYGVDTDDDGFADQYLDADEINAFTSLADMQEWHNVRTVRIWLLLRTERPETGHTDSKTYTMGDTVVTPDNSYRHALFTTTIALRNYLG
jgi:type IV pilus assembly protein PilW